MLTVCERIAEDRQPDRDVPYAPNCGCMDAALEITGGALAGFSKHRWPADGPERELLEYLDELHREQGQPSMARIAKAVGLVAGTVSASALFGTINQIATYATTPVFGEVALLAAAIVLIRVLPQGITGRFFRRGM